MDAGACYSAASVAGAALASFLVALLLVLGGGLLLYRLYWRARRGKHLVLVTDAEAVGDQYAFDNPCFRDGTSLGQTTLEKDSQKLDHKTRWSAWSPIVALVSNHSDKRRALDDSFIGEPHVQVVSLRSHDFTGLGFTVCGNMRDGIFVKEVLHRGPASESGCIAPGDRIDSIRICFRHMVFEDALTILSYASPYEVQLEVENVASSRPSTLVNTKKMSGTIGSTADRICHPFYRSQSIADLAQIGKDSLKRTHQLCGIKSTPRVSKRDSFNNSAVNDYPTLKKSSPSNVQIAKETLKLNLSECVDIVKPERSKKNTSKSSSPIQKSSANELDDSLETANKYKKFGIRVLPDTREPLKTSSPTHDTDVSYKIKINEKQGTIPDLIDSNKIEKEHHQNENNAIIEKTVTTSKSGALKDKQQNIGNSQEYGNNKTSCSNFYAERGIDVGEEQETFRPREYEVKKRNQEINNSVNVHNEIKLGKDTNDDLRFSSGHIDSQAKLNEFKIKKPAAFGKLTKQSSQNESNNSGEENEIITTTKNNFVMREDDTDGQTAENKNLVDKNTIPTEIPEEVCKAAMAAQSNRRSVNNTNIPLSKINKLSLNTEDLPKNISEDSSSDASSGILSDEYGKHTKKSNKRKAPPPPPDDIDNKQKVSDEYVVSTTENLEVDNNINNNFLKCKNSTNTSANDDIHFKKDIDHLENNAISYDSKKLYTAIDSENLKTILSFKNFAEQLDNQEKNQDVTQILIQDGNQKNINQASYQGSEKDDKIETNNLMEKVVQENISKHNTVDGEGSHLTSNVCDSDSDLETFDADFVLEGVKNKIGGTTIELNSSQITVHHSPSSTSVSVDLESETNRKTASLGDLSRLDTDQPMSILERAVSLDLADGVSPIGTKKRKAPQPPAGDECIGSLQDFDDGNVYKKEPRLDIAVDTYGRRLKKSSDWGTMEEALKQTENMEALCKMESLEHNFKGLPSNVDCLNNFTSSPLQTKDLDDSVFISEVHNINNSSDIAKPKLDSEDINKDEYVSNSLISEKAMFKSSSDNETFSEESSGSKVDSSCTAGLFASEPSNIQVADIFSANRPILLAVSRKTTDDGESLDFTPSDTFGIVNSTPLSTTSVSTNKDFVNISPIIHKKEKLSEGAWHTPTLSYNSKVSNYSFKDSSAEDTNNEIASATDPFITATSNIFVHKTAQNNPTEDDINWNLDTKPPDLPTSPIPVLPQSTGPFNPSSSMTYVTEIQVVTSDNNRHSDKLPPRANIEGDLSIINSDLKPNVTIQNITKNDFSITPKVDDSDIKLGENKKSNTMVHGSKNVTVTSITPPPLTPDLKMTDISAVGSFIATADNVHNKKNNYERPPVPPRKYDMGVSVSSVVKDVYKSLQQPENVSPTLLSNTSNSPSENISGNFVSFSTLTPRTSKYGDKAFQNNSSFEQWVFLEDTSEPSTTKPNNLDNTFVQTVDTSRPLNTTLSTFASPNSSKAQSITNIILDTEKNSGQALNK